MWCAVCWMTVALSFNLIFFESSKTLTVPKFSLLSSEVKVGVSRYEAEVKRRGAQRRGVLPSRVEIRDRNSSLPLIPCKGLIWQFVGTGIIFGLALIFVISFRILSTCRYVYSTPNFCCRWRNSTSSSPWTHQSRSIITKNSWNLSRNMNFVFNYRKERYLPFLCNPHALTCILVDTRGH